MAIQKKKKLEYLFTSCFPSYSWERFGFLLNYEVDDMFSDSEPKEPPGFSLLNNHQNNKNEEQHNQELQPPMPHIREPVEAQEEDTQHSKDVVEPEYIDLGLPPGFPADLEQKLPCDGSDEDPDVPPGFGWCEDKQCNLSL